MASSSLMDSLFQKSLDDVIKGLRLCPPGTESSLISKSIDEIRREIKSTDTHTKATALEKLTYLHSIHGVDMSWAAFHSVELSSSSVHSHKRVAFLSAALSFNPSTTDVILLLTHQLRKDLSSSNAHDVSLALSTLSSICNLDLSRDLTPELFTLLGSSKVFVRKKAISAVLKVFEQYPDAVRVCFKRVVENLENSDVGILSAVVGLFCELTVKEPNSCLPLAPEFYKILVDCRNNWILIKVLKIFAKLAPLEPRLGKRVVEPICEHLGRTGAKSLMFECIRTILTSLSEYESAVKLAIGKVREFLLDEDSNLNYLGLQALAIVAQNHMWAVLENKDLVVKALSDIDVNIKLEALRLVMSMVSEDNVKDICRILINHSVKSDPEFCNEILGFLLFTCSRNFYEVVYDFDWYVSFLGEMARIPHCQKGREIETQLVDIGMRVRDARNELVQVARDLVIDPALLGNMFVHDVLAAAAWISGEYVVLSRNPFELMEALLQPRTSLLSPSVRSVYIHSAFKVLVFCVCSYVNLNEDEHSNPSLVTHLVSKGNLLENAENVTSDAFSDAEVDNKDMSRNRDLTKESIMGLVNFVETNLGSLSGSDEVEIHERASNILGFIKLVKSKLQCGDDETEGAVSTSETIKVILDVFSEELGPISVNAQGRIPVPDGLVLKENLNELEDISDDDKLSLPTSFSLVRSRVVENDHTSNVDECLNKVDSEATESTSLLAEHRKRHGIYYLSSDSKGKVSSNDYPPAHDPNEKPADEVDDLVKLAEQSLVLKKKPNQAKPRPVVVRLDDGEESHVASTKKSEVNTDLLSGAVQEMLLCNEPTSKRKSSKRREMDGTSGSRNGTVRNSKSEVGRRKEKRHIEENDKAKKSSRHHKHKSRERTDGSLVIGTQSAEIPDFLL